MKPRSEELSIPAEWYEVATCVDRYEDSVGEELPDLALILEGVSQAHRLPALCELVEVDMEYRSRRGVRKTLEQYLREFPELRNHPTLLGGLLEGSSQSPGGTVVGQDRPSSSLSDAPSTLGFSSASTDDHLAASRNLGVRLAGQPEDLRIGKYLVKAELGRGSFGTVYRCLDPDLGRTVAIKVAHEVGRKQAAGLPVLRHEAQAAARVRHPGIVGVLEFGQTDDGRPYIVYEYVAGKTLSRCIRSGGYTLGEAVRWTADIAAALHEAHRQGLVHRDVKPANILVDEQGVPHLTDFGLAKRDDHFIADDRCIVGTGRYMSPEQADQRSEWASPASDIYALGVVLYELLCGRVPFRSELLPELLEEVKYRQPDAPRSINDAIPPAVEEACLKALAKNPADRFRTAGDFAAALRAAIRPARSGPSPWLTASLVVLSAMLVAALALVAWRLMAPALPQLAVLDLEAAVKAASDGKVYTPGECLPLGGDKVQIHAELNREAYLYLVLYRDQARPTLCWPPEDCIDDPPKVRWANFPAEEDQWVEIPHREGVILVLCVAADRPMPASELQEFLVERPPLPKPIGQPLVTAIAHPRPSRSERAPGVVFRGGPDEGPEPMMIRTDDSFLIPRQFHQQVEDTFDTYYGILFSHAATRSSRQASPE